ncbi:hypothetical protein JAAARDRAFT_198641 [Jaapia argillacea MUCL 33604]|uniref:Uncharacterized protein n=1 Tax=Jaapia argillacea MUCL 33604 TaxID=933084 RepID=A0A067PB70_9AGAM|nr:hypothetical protein JAAARDRAFT_198641 [Jaapia argillacea MUCL 33604]
MVTKISQFQVVLVTTFLVISVAALPMPRSVVCVPTTWHDIAVFFVANYIAHAATIPTAPGAKWYDTAAWTILCVLLPFAGLGKSLGLILSHFLVGSSDLEKALAREALAVVVRSDDWEPTGDPEEIYVKLPSGFDESPTTLPPATIFCNNQDDFTRVTSEHIQVHGRVLLPKGYCLGFPEVDGLLSQ